MPYINKHKRKLLDPHLNELGEELTTGGDINYCIVKMCLKFIKNTSESYQHYAECLAAIEGAKQELYRKHIAPYEDIKEKENGGIYG